MTFPSLQYFTEAEFGVWANDMCPDLLAKMDKFREFWGRPVAISPHPDALGRELPITSKSMHNINLYGVVRACDSFPTGMTSKEELKRAYECAKEAGFTGIGLYTDTSPGYMIHLDNRDGDRVATWSRIKGKYLAIEEAWK